MVAYGTEGHTAHTSPGHQSLRAEHLCRAALPRILAQDAIPQSGVTTHLSSGSSSKGGTGYDGFAEERLAHIGNMMEHAVSACRLTEEGHIVGIAPEKMYILLYPPEGTHLVGYPQIVGDILRMMQKAEAPQTIGHAHYHHMSHFG